MQKIKKLKYRWSTYNNNNMLLLYILQSINVFTLQGMDPAFWQSCKIYFFVNDTIYSYSLHTDFCRK